MTIFPKMSHYNIRQIKNELWKKLVASNHNCQRITSMTVKCSNHYAIQPLLQHHAISPVKWWSCPQYTDQCRPQWRVHRTVTSMIIKTPPYTRHWSLARVSQRRTKEVHANDENYRQIINDTFPPNVSLQHRTNKKWTLKKMSGLEPQLSENHQHESQML